MVIEMPSEPRRRRKPWEQWEYDWLRQHYHILGAECCAKELRRTKRAIYEKASALGIAADVNRYRAWDESEEAILHSALLEMARILGKSPGAIIARMKRLCDIHGYSWRWRICKTCKKPFLVGEAGKKPAAPLPDYCSDECRRKAGKRREAIATLRAD